jgi:hypothetical protein
LIIISQSYYFSTYLCGKIILCNPENIIQKSAEAIHEVMFRRRIMTLTSKELMLIQDKIKMTENSIKFTQGCAEIAVDAQVKGLCQSMAKEYQSDLQTLAKHVSSATIQ